MNLSLGKRWEDFMESAVANGRYKSSSEIVREGLRLVEEREAKLLALRKNLSAAIEEGVTYTEDEVDAYLDEGLEELEREMQQKA